jgi:hypothetical protein
MEVMRLARRLLSGAWSRRVSIRLLGVALSNLVGPDRQLQLPFGAQDACASSAIDRVRQRFGYAAIRRATS